MPHLTMKGEKMRERDGKKFGLDLPEGKICGDCKNFSICVIKEWAVEDDKQCALLPSNFALEGEESKAETHNRNHRKLYREQP